MSKQLKPLLHPRLVLLALPAAAVTAASLWALASVTLDAAAGSRPGDLLHPLREQALEFQLGLADDAAERARIELEMGRFSFMEPGLVDQITALTPTTTIESTATEQTSATPQPMTVAPPAAATASTAPTLAPTVPLPSADPTVPAPVIQATPDDHGGQRDSGDDDNSGSGSSSDDDGDNSGPGGGSDDEPDDGDTDSVDDDDVDDDDDND